MNCKNCGGYCPSGTSPNGLCSDCELIGKQIQVDWARFGLRTCKVVKVTKRGIYAVRWNQRQDDWTTTPRRIVFRFGFWRLK